MITKFDKGLNARFGCGSIKIKTEELKSGFKRLELTQIKSQDVGSEVSVKTKSTPKTSKIHLDFGSVESVDVVIDYLTEVRELLLRGKNG